MDPKRFKPEGAIVRGTTRQITLYIFYISIIVLMTHLNALVDLVIHPEIPYFDQEHLVVGGVTGLLSTVLFGLLILYTRHLENAVSRIQTLESMLPICAYCKKIRLSDSDPNKKESWQSVESYFTERTATQFSHGICPECLGKADPQYGKSDTK